MLSPRFLANCSDDIVKLYADLEHDIIVDMAKRLVKLGKVTDASTYQAEIFKSVGGLRENIIKHLGAYDKKAQKEILKLFDDALNTAQNNDLKVIKEAGRSLSDSQAQVLNATAQKVASAGIVGGSKKVAQEVANGGAIKTFSSLQRLTMTIASTASDDFVTAANKAYFQTVSGAFDYNTALFNAVDSLAKKGVHTVEYTDSGKVINRSIESAVRSNILTGINQTASAQTLNNCDATGTDLVEVSAHIGARPEHEALQGRVYCLNGEREYIDGDGNRQIAPDFRTTCKIGEPDGIGGINCRHSFYPYFEGTDRLYTDKELDEYKEPLKELDGQKITQYEAEQKLRGAERAIRKYKLEADALEASGQDNTAARLKLGSWQARARDICKQTGINRDYAREYIGTKSGVQPRGLTIKETQLKSGAPVAPVISVTSVNNIKEVDYSILTDDKKSNTRDLLEKGNVKEVKVFSYIKQPTETEIINKLGGGDLTSGSCSSLANAFIANIGGFDVTDYRGGKSRDIFASRATSLEMIKFNGVEGYIVANKSDYTAVKELLKNVVENKYYKLGTGRHAAIIRKNGTIYEYLEMQTENENGWYTLNMDSLKKRFKCQRSHSVAGIKLEVKNYLIEASSLAKNREYIELMKYLNTNTQNQNKGVGGFAK